MNIKKFLIGTVAGALMLGALAVPAFASTPPAAVSSAPNVCWDHGTFQALQGNPAIFDGGTLTVSQDAKEDGGMGAETGPANSASCQP